MAGGDDEKTAREAGGCQKGVVALTSQYLMPLVLGEAVPISRNTASNGTSVRINRNTVEISILGLAPC